MDVSVEELSLRSGKSADIRNNETREDRKRRSI